MGCFIDTLLCAFGPKPCFFFCFPNLKESTTTRIWYSVILVVVAILVVVSQEDSLLDTIYTKYNTKIDTFCERIRAGKQCSRIIGFRAIYRLCLPLFCFHISMALFTIMVSSSLTIRGRIHNGFWIWKILIMIGIYVLAYLFPFVEDHTTIWMIVGIVGAFIFVVVQQVTQIDFAYEINHKWYEKSKSSRVFNFYIYLCTLLLYGASIAGYITFLLLFGLPHRCILNITMVGINSGLTVLFTVGSLFSSTLRERQTWLPGAVTSAFVAFLTWVALTSQPSTLSSDEQTMVHLKLNLFSTSIDVQADEAGGTSVQDSTPTVNRCFPVISNTLGDHMSKDIITFISLAIVLLGLLYSSVSTSIVHKRVGIRSRKDIKGFLSSLRRPSDLNGNTSRNPTSLASPSSDNNEPAEWLPMHEGELVKPTPDGPVPRDNFIVYNEFRAPVYSYSWFHFIYALSTLYLMAQLTNWYNPHASNLKTILESWASMWMTMASSWIAVLVYVWTVIFSKLCFGRKLGDSLSNSKTTTLTSPVNQSV